MPIICAGDVETDGLGGKLLMVQWGFFGEVYYSTGDNAVADFFDVFLTMPRPCIFYFHFGQYDWRYFLDYIIEQDLDVEIGLRTESDIYEIRCKVKGEKTWCVMRDSYALWSRPLESLANTFCPEIPKLEIDIENFNPENPDHIEYAKRDVQILLVGLPRLFEMMYLSFGVYPSATAAGTAIKAWQASLPDDTMYDCSKWGADEQFLRSGYYGGLVFLTDNSTHEDVETYDINSSYPYNMEKYGVPYGRAIYTTEFEEHYAGFYRVNVTAPDNLVIPILPARNARGAMRWYRGTFETVVTVQELQFAVEHGYVINEIYEGLIFEDIVFPFATFIGACKDIRKTHKGQALEDLAKLNQNSLYGKYGSRRERTNLIRTDDFDFDELETFGGELVPFDDAGFWCVTKELDEDMPCIPQWAAWITANARLTLLRAAYAVGVENVLYGDTDSLTIKKGFSHLIDTGDEYGQWKLDKKWKKFRAIAPKVYTGIIENKDGTLSFGGAAKGLPRKGITQKHWQDLLENGETSAETLSLDSLKVAFKRGIKPAVTMRRKSSTLENSQNFYAENGKVRVKYA